MNSFVSMVKRKKGKTTEYVMENIAGIESTIYNININYTI